MAVYQYKEQLYDIDDKYSKEEALAKIKKHLGEEDLSLGQKLTAGIHRAAETLPAYMDEELSRVAGNVLQSTGVIPPAPEGTQFHSTGAEQSAIKAAQDELTANQQSSMPTAIASGLLGAAPWVVLMVLAEALLARLMFGYPWSRVAEDFDPSRGGLLAFGMGVLLLAPWAMAQLRGPVSPPR